MLQPVMRKLTENATKITHQLPHYYFQSIQAIIIWKLSEKCY